MWSPVVCLSECPTVKKVNIQHFQFLLQNYKLEHSQMKLETNHTWVEKIQFFSNERAPPFFKGR